MKKMMLVGSTSAGKTTLVQALGNKPLRYKKTQSLEYGNSLLDTPGEFIENRRFYSALISASVDYQLVALVYDSTSKQHQFPPGFASMFNKKVIGIITKLDDEQANLEQSRRILKQAGATIIFEVSSLTRQGLSDLDKYLEEPIAFSQ